MGKNPAAVARIVSVQSVSPDVAFEACLAEMHGNHDVAHRDCCRTAGWAFERMFGVNPVTNATYKTQWGALRYLARFGGAEACHEALARASGLIACAPVSGVIGSIRTDQSYFGWVLGICVQNNEWGVMGVNGFTVVESDDVRAWGLEWV